MDHNELVRRQLAMEEKMRELAAAMAKVQELADLTEDETKILALVLEHPALDL